MTRVLNRILRGERGFTLIEMLVVIAIIALLLAIAAPKVINSLGKARDTRAKANIDVIQGALEQFREEYGQYPAHLGLLKTYGYVKNGFDFKNGYGAYYFYATNVDTDPKKSFKQYVLADPGPDALPTPNADNGSPTDTKPPEGVEPGAATQQILYWGAGGITVVQGIDVNHDGTVSSAETTTYSNANALQYGTGRPTKTSPWTTYTGPYATEQE